MIRRVVFFLALFGCASCAKRYRVEGLIVHVDSAQRTILVSHRPIEHYMPPMTMPFHVAPKEDLTGLAPGARISFDLRVGKHASEARNLKPRVTRLEGTDGKEIPVAQPANKLAVGAAVPDFTLTDQSGRPTALSQFRGRVVAIDFIYTRCPLPDVCPRLSANFAYLSKRLRGRDFELISITIDPTWDRPEVLAEYAHRWQADGETWRFLTGPVEQIGTVAGLFGLIYWPEEGSITHTVATAIVSRDGRLAALIEGSSYRPDQLLALVQHSLDPS
ncbi:MAG TPA: SCO family protein [Bryobacteraceae bacterium]|nr:SCO family protein [Bryobacteraceae bacterium]